jgi:hypothetical protein
MFVLTAPTATLSRRAPFLRRESAAPAVMHTLHIRYDAYPLAVPLEVCVTSPAAHPKPKPCSRWSLLQPLRGAWPLAHQVRGLRA